MRPLRPAPHTPATSPDSNPTSSSCGTVRVNATPAQERAIGAAVEEFRDDIKKLGGGEARRSRQEIADALRRPTFDGVVLGEQFARHDTVIEGARKAFVGLVAHVHDTLEPEQRAQLASLVERGPRFGWWQ